ncbi:MAG: hypothetical protein R3C44_21175 [Chloroflexota bacterium]
MGTTEIEIELTVDYLPAEERESVGLVRATANYECGAPVGDPPVAADYQLIPYATENQAPSFQPEGELFKDTGTGADYKSASRHRLLWRG